MHVIHKYRGTYETNQLEELKVIALGSGKWRGQENFLLAQAL